MKRLLLLSVLFAVTLTSCNKDTVKFKSDLNAGLLNELQTTISTAARWTANWTQINSKNY